MTKGVSSKHQREDRLRLLRQQRAQAAAALALGAKTPPKAIPRCHRRRHGRQRRPLRASARLLAIGKRLHQYCTNREAREIGMAALNELTADDRWRPTLGQISVAIDCAAAKMSLEKAAELLGVGPDKLWLFARQIGLPIFSRWEGIPACAVAARAGETPVPVHSGIPAPSGDLEP
jgi:hypothetical protein